jgi:carbonic anhydrase/acetyltransferase-like protein (isoleucine patch superfamily)
MSIYKLDGVAPTIDPTAWIADSAQVIGRVHMHKDSNVWFGTVIRGDNDLIEIGEGSNVQDNCTLHTDSGMPLTIGRGVTVGHQVTLHGCSIGEGSLIGIGSVVLNGAKIGKNCLVGAGALVTEGKEFADGSMILGSPAKVVKSLSEEQINALYESAKRYVENANRFKNGLVKID